MALETSNSKTAYTIDAAVRDYPIPWPFYDDGDIVVVVGQSGRESTLASGSDYSILPATGTQTYGGTLRLSAAGETGKTLVVMRRMPLIQLTRLPLTGKLDTEAIERQFDRTIMIVQQLSEEVSRCVKAPVTEAGGDLYGVFMGAKDICLTCADICATSSQTCAAAERTIGLVWAQLTGDANLANAALLALREIGEAAGAVKAAAEAGKAGINEASSAALAYARGQVDEAKVQAVTTLSSVTQAETDKLTALISEAVGADGAVTAAKNAAQKAAADATGAANGIDAKAASAQASLDAAKAVAQGFLDTATTKAQEAVDNATQANSSSLAALTEIRDSIATASGHKNAAGGSAAAALKSAQDAALAKSNAEAAAAAASNTSQTVANASITAHNVNNQSHPDIRNLAGQVNNRIGKLEGDLAGNGIFPQAQIFPNVDFDHLSYTGNFMGVGPSVTNCPLDGNGILNVSRCLTAGGDIFCTQEFHHWASASTWTRRWANKSGWTAWTEYAMQGDLTTLRTELTTLIGSGIKHWNSGSYPMPTASLVLSHNLNLLSPWQALADVALICAVANNGYDVGDVVTPGARATDREGNIMPVGVPTIIVGTNTVRLQLPATKGIFYILEKGSDAGVHRIPLEKGDPNWNIVIRLWY